MPSKMIRVEITDERDEFIMNVLTPAERRAALIAAGEAKIQNNRRTPAPQPE